VLHAVPKCVTEASAKAVIIDSGKCRQQQRQCVADVCLTTAFMTPENSERFFAFFLI
jgi:hypothetical protein